MTVKIVTDSTSDLTPEIAGELGITVVPLYVHFGTEAYRDGVDLTTDDFYRKLVQSKTLPTTATPAPRTFAEVYDRLAEETDEILAIVISSKLSATYEAAVEGKELRKSKSPLEIIDSLWATMGLGLIVISAAKAAQAGASLDEVIDVARSSMRRVDFRMAFDTLEYLRRGGRIGTAQAFLGSMLKVNPILTIKDGCTEAVARTRSRAKAIDYLCDFAMSFSHIEEMAIEDATTPDEAEMLVERLLQGKPLSKDDLVFSNVDGTAMDPGTLTHNFAKIARKAGLPGTRFHDLRHTFASLMLLAGIHPKIVSEMLGHSSVAFTLDTYSHVIGGLQRAAMRRLDEVLQPELIENQDVCKMFVTDPEQIGQGKKFEPF